MTDTTDDSGKHTANTSTTLDSDVERLSLDSDERNFLNGQDTQDTDPLDHEGREHIEAMTQTRFKHVETEDGHMVLTGRDGVLMRCEDEPIHIPGAVQQFGCMVVVREDTEGALVVRQASEVSC